MKDGLSFYLCVLAAGWILVAGLRALLRRPPQAARRAPGPEQPRGQGLQALAGLLAATPSSPYSRERVQERLGLLAQDLSSLEGEDRSGATDAYFAEDHVGFRSAAAGKRALDPGFLHRTEDVLRELEHRAHTPQEGRP